MIIHDVEQGTEEWFELRAGIPTASEFTKILTAAKLELSAQSNDFAHQCAAERLMNKPDIAWSGNKYTERGHLYEAEALKCFQYMTGKKAKAVGFVTNDDATCGASPDALVLGENGGVEIKCPSGKVHTKYAIDGVLPAEHRLQVHGGMYVTGAKHWDFMSYHPDLKPFIIRVKRDTAINKLIKAAMEKFEKLVLKSVEGMKLDDEIDKLFIEFRETKAPLPVTLDI